MEHNIQERLEVEEVLRSCKVSNTTGNIMHLENKSNKINPNQNVIFQSDEVV